MFVREKRIGSYRYPYLVETVRENGQTKQRIIRNLGRKEVVEAGGDLDRLARSAARLSQRSMILSLIEDGSIPDLTCRRIGAPLLLERLWQESGCRAVVEKLLAGRRFEFAVERAVFLTVLHRLMVSGSDRACEHWRDDYRIDGIDELQLHHLYRAMSWLGEELPETEQAARTLAPRCIKDLVEERLFARRRDLFSELSVVFMDTTTLYFEGRGGDTLGQRGHTKDYRPHLNQMVVGIIMDQNGRPVCSEMWPGNTTDVTTLLPVIDRLRQRFAIGRVCVVADRGMISDATIAGLEERKLEYILGVRERNSKEVYELVPNDQKPSVPPVIPRGQRRDTELEAKNVWVGDRRYVGGESAKIVVLQRFISDSRSAPMPTECTPDFFGFEPVEGREVVAAFDTGAITSDAGALLLGATDRAIKMMDRFASCFHDVRRAELIEHEVATLVGQRVFGIALGYEDLNDHDELRHDPMMAVLAGKLEARREDCAPVAGKSTLNRLELSRLEPTRYHKISHNPMAIRRLFVDLFLEAHGRPAKQIILDLDSTDDPLHGEQEGRFFHGYYDCYCYLPLYVFCGRHLLAAKPNF